MVCGILNRRNHRMKKRRKWPIAVGVLVVILVGLFAYLFTGSKNPNTTAVIENGDPGTKSIVVYFSRDYSLAGNVDAVTSATPSTNGGNTGDTEAAAQMIQNETGADMYAIQVEQYYRTPYLATAATSWAERQFNIHPSLTALPESLDEYETIYIGYPVWWFDAPMAVVSFLENYDLTGKTVVPFATSQDNDIDITMDTIREAAGNAVVLDGMRIHYAEQSDVQNWLRNIGILK